LISLEDKDQTAIRKTVGRVDVHFPFVLLKYRV